MNRESLISLKQKKVLKKLILIFNRYKIKYAISGGLACIIYGAANRKLFDIDIMTDSKGFKILTQLLKNQKVQDEKFKKDKNLKMFEINYSTFNINDVLVDIGDFKNTFLNTKKGRFKLPIKLKDAKEVIFSNFKLKVRPVEELIIQKFIHGREFDKKDIQEITKNTKINFKYLEQRARKIDVWNKLKKEMDDNQGIIRKINK